jgi:hypothetical protein
MDGGQSLLLSKQQLIQALIASGAAPQDIVDEVAQLAPLTIPFSTISPISRHLEL